ncbi:MAG: N-6 DNA methylase [Burkholderiales bacterium]|nr:N-6 DNA methylase [Burkholderiales bacterium]
MGRARCQDAPALYDVVLTNPPFGGKEGKDAQTRFPYKTGATQVLFLQHVIDSLKPGGRCGIVIEAKGREIQEAITQSRAIKP